MKRKENNYKLWLYSVLGILIILPIIWIYLVCLESDPPKVVLDSKTSLMGVSQELSGHISDQKTGIRGLWVSIYKDGKEIELYKESFPLNNFFKGGSVFKSEFKFKFDPKELSLSDGKAILRLTCSDYSWRNWWHGNKTYIEKEIQIDTKPPQIVVLSNIHNITQGGSGLVIYQLSEACKNSGVDVEGNLFPGYSGYFQDKSIYLCFFALDYQQGPGTKLRIKATDDAGNSAMAGFPNHIRRKVFRNDVIPISDHFLSTKMIDFQEFIPDANSKTLIEKFLYVNQTIRKQNAEKIFEVAGNTDSVIYWEGDFLRLPKAAKRAGFADHREYKYNGKIVDRQVHLGIDLASIAYSDVPAANRGKVAFVGYIGIYGNTVIIDHGFDLFSMYSHLSKIDVQKGQIVLKGEIIGRTGSTGLAGGDHLHYSMFIHNKFVNPLEWWDLSWIKNNITDKLNLIAARVK